MQKPRTLEHANISKTRKLEHEKTRKLENSKTRQLENTTRRQRENSKIVEFMNLRDKNWCVSWGEGCERMLQAAPRAHDGNVVSSRTRRVQWKGRWIGGEIDCNRSPQVRNYALMFWLIWNMCKNIEAAKCAVAASILAPVDWEIAVDEGWML